MKKFVSIAIIALSFCSAVFAQNNRAQLTQAIDKYINEVLETWQLPGMAVAISLDNETLLAKGYGTKELRPEDGIGYRGMKASNTNIATGGYRGVVNEPNSRIDENTIFQIGSVSKSFTATVMGQLVDEGLVKWSDTVKNILPDFKYYDPWVTENMQVIDIMTHRSGLGGQVGTYLPNIGYDRDDIYKMLALIKPSYGFRGDYQYNNSTFIIAQKIIEKLTGKSWEENLQQRVFDKVGMKNSSVNAKGFANSKNVATPHDYSFTTPTLAKAQFPNLVKVSENDTPSIVTLPLYSDEQALNWLTGIGPAGSVCSNVVDMLRYAQMHMNNGIVVDVVRSKMDVEGEPSARDTTFVMSSNAVKRLHKGVTITSEDVNRTTIYAQCWFVEQNDRYRLYFHTGTTWGMTALCFFVPKINLCGVILVNSEAGSNPRYAIMNRMIDLVMDAPFKDYNKIYFDKWLSDNQKQWKEDLEKKAEDYREAENISPVKDKVLVGEYVKDELFGNAKITKEKGNLYISIGKMGYKNKLVHIKGDKYEFRSDGHGFPVTFTFDKDRKLATGFVVDFNYGEQDSFGGWNRK